MVMVLTERRTKLPVEDNDQEPAGQMADELNPAIVGDLVQLFKLLADETRLRVLFYLMSEKELNVRALCDRLEQSQPAVSHHLALLRVAGLIAARRDGKHNFYHILPERFAELLNLVFKAVPDQDGRIRFADRQLTLSRVNGE